MLRLTKKYIPIQQTVNCIFMQGGLGDHIGSLVAVDYILKNYPWVNLLIWVPNFLVEFAKNVLPSHAIVRSYSDMRTKYDRNRLTITTEWDGRTSPMKMHTVDYAFIKLCDKIVEPSEKNYLKVKFKDVDVSSFSLPDNYVTIATGYTAPVREFNPATVNGVSSWCRLKGLTPVFLGQKETKTGGHNVIQGMFNSKIDYNAGIDLRDMTSLLQAARVIQGSKAFLGVDCGLMHVAGCTDTPIVCGFTTVKPELRAPVRNNTLGYQFYPVTPGAILECRFCQSETAFLKGHDYKFCIYEDYQCVKELTADKFIKHLGEILATI